MPRNISCGSISKYQSVINSKKKHVSFNENTIESSLSQLKSYTDLHFKENSPHSSGFRGSPEEERPLPPSGSCHTLYYRGVCCNEKCLYSHKVADEEAVQFLGDYLVYSVKSNALQQHAIWSVLDQHAALHSQQPLFVLAVLRKLARYLIDVPSAAAHVQVPSQYAYILDCARLDELCSDDAVHGAVRNRGLAAAEPAYRLLRRAVTHVAHPVQKHTLIAYVCVCACVAGNSEGAWAPSEKVVAAGLEPQPKQQEDLMALLDMTWMRCFTDDADAAMVQKAFFHITKTLTTGSDFFHQIYREYALHHQKMGLHKEVFTVLPVLRRLRITDPAPYVMLLSLNKQKSDEVPTSAVRQLCQVVSELQVPLPGQHWCDLVDVLLSRACRQPHLLQLTADTLCVAVRLCPNISFPTTLMEQLLTQLITSREPQFETYQQLVLSIPPSLLRPSASLLTSALLDFSIPSDLFRERLEEIGVKVYKMSTPANINRPQSIDSWIVAQPTEGKSHFTESQCLLSAPVPLKPAPETDAVQPSPPPDKEGCLSKTPLMRTTVNKKLALSCSEKSLHHVNSKPEGILCVTEEGTVQSCHGLQGASLKDVNEEEEYLNTSLLVMQTRESQSKNKSEDELLKTATLSTNSVTDAWQPKRDGQRDLNGHDQRFCCSMKTACSSHTVPPRQLQELLPEKRLQDRVNGTMELCTKSVQQRNILKNVSTLFKNKLREFRKKYFCLNAAALMSSDDTLIKTSNSSARPTSNEYLNDLQLFVCSDKYEQRNKTDIDKNLHFKHFPVSSLEVPSNINRVSSDSNQNTKLQSSVTRLLRKAEFQTNGGEFQDATEKNCVELKSLKRPLHYVKPVILDKPRKTIRLDGNESFSVPLLRHKNKETCPKLNKDRLNALTTSGMSVDRSSCDINREQKCNFKSIRYVEETLSNSCNFSYASSSLVSPDGFGDGVSCSDAGSVASLQNNSNFCNYYCSIRNSEEQVNPVYDKCNDNSSLSSNVAGVTSKSIGTENGAIKSCIVYFPDLDVYDCIEEIEEDILENSGLNPSLASRLGEKCIPFVHPSQMLDSTSQSCQIGDYSVFRQLSGKNENTSSQSSCSPVIDNEFSTGRKHLTGTYKAPPERGGEQQARSQSGYTGIVKRKFIVRPHMMKEPATESLTDQRCTAVSNPLPDCAGFIEAPPSCVPTSGFASGSTVTSRGWNAEFTVASTVPTCILNASSTTASTSASGFTSDGWNGSSTTGTAPAAPACAFTVSASSVTPASTYYIDRKPSPVPAEVATLLLGRDRLSCRTHSLQQQQKPSLSCTAPTTQHWVKYLLQGTVAPLAAQLAVVAKQFDVKLSIAGYGNSEGLTNTVIVRDDFGTSVEDEALLRIVEALTAHALIKNATENFEKMLELMNGPPWSSGKLYAVCSVGCSLVQRCSASLLLPQAGAVASAMCVRRLPFLRYQPLQREKEKSPHAPQQVALVVVHALYAIQKLQQIVQVITEMQWGEIRADLSAKLSMSRAALRLLLLSSNAPPTACDKQETSKVGTREHGSYSSGGEVNAPVGGVQRRGGELLLACQILRMILKDYHADLRVLGDQYSSYLEVEGVVTCVWEQVLHVEHSWCLYKRPGTEVDQLRCLFAQLVASAHVAGVTLAPCVLRWCENFKEKKIA